MSVNPPALNTTPKTSRRFQFSGAFTNTSTSVIVTRRSLMSLLLAVPGALGGVAQTAIPIISACRIKRVIMHSAVANTTATGNPTATIFNGPQIDWTSDLGPLNRKFRASMTASVPARQTSSPPRGSRASAWSHASATTSTLNEILFTMGIADGNQLSTDVYRVVVTLDLEIATDDTDGSSIALVVSSATGVGIYGNWLDSMTTAGGLGTLVFEPLGLSVLGTTAQITTMSRTN